MADVNVGSTTRDRGQLILLTGLIVAVTMVAMVLLLNTAIYTENLASRGGDQNPREAIEYRAVVVDGVGGLIDEENAEEHGSFSTVRTNVEDGIDTIDNFSARNYAYGGTVVRINQSAVEFSSGALIRQTDPSRAFQNKSGGADDWELASDIEQTRSFSMDVNLGSLNETEASDAPEAAFQVVLEDSSGTEWIAFVYENESTGNIAVATKVGGGSIEQTCSETASEATVDFTEGALAGEPCPGLQWAEGITDPYDIKFVHGSNGTGTYNLTVNTGPASASVNSTNLNDGTTTPNSPYHVPAVYSVSFEVSYESPTLTYRSDVRVAPGEPE